MSIEAGGTANDRKQDDDFLQFDVNAHAVRLSTLLLQPCPPSFRPACRFLYPNLVVFNHKAGVFMLT